MRPCKHLDHDPEKYPDCRLVTDHASFSVPVTYWQRPEFLWKSPHPDAPDGAREVQFCGLGRGRINNAIDCYTGGGHCAHCYEPNEDWDSGRMEP